MFTTDNTCKIGLNAPSNRLRSVSNMIEKKSGLFLISIMRLQSTQGSETMHALSCKWYGDLKLNTTEAS